MRKHIVTSTYKLLQPIVEGLENTIVISNVDVLQDGTYNLYTCDTRWLTIARNITIGASEFTIIDLKVNEYLILKPVETITGFPNVSSFLIERPHFFHGSIQQTEIELNIKRDLNLLAEDRMPMIWLQEPLRERFNYDSGITLERSSKCSLHFIVDADFEVWSQEQHFQYGIEPMRNLVAQFLDELDLSGITNDLTDYELIDLPRFGRYITRNGSETAIFAQYELDGVKMDVDIDFIKQDEICCET